MIISSMVRQILHRCKQKVNTSASSAYSIASDEDEEYAPEYVLPSVAACNSKDVDDKIYRDSGKKEQHAQSSNNLHMMQKLSAGDVLTISMVWTNIYGLGVASFFTGYICTMASTLSTFSFVVGLSVVSVYEAVAERIPSEKNGDTGKLRNGLHFVSLILSLITMILMGVHVANINMNSIGNIRAEDVFFGILGPLLTPLLLKSVKRPNTTILGTLEISFPVTMFICVTFMSTALALGMRPYESNSELARNMVAVTIMLPSAWGTTLYFIMYCTCRKRVVYIFSTFLVVFAGREFTLSKSDRIVISCFAFSIIPFILVVVSSSWDFLRWLSKI
jgi:hypothetical protein